MEILIKAARISYGIMMAALGIQQLFYGTFRPVILPPFTFPGIEILVYLTSAVLVLASFAIIFDKDAREVSLIFGVVFLALFVFCQVPYMLFADPNFKHLGEWANAEKELVFAGGGFIVAASYQANENGWKKSFINKFIPFGSVLVCITMVSFGLDHLFYAQGVSTLVPSWIPGSMFWTYFAGAALIAAGLGIALQVQLKLAALLLAAMIFIWFIILHIPRGIADPYGLQGNEISSVFESFGFSGIAYLIACGYGTRKASKPLPAVSRGEVQISA